MKNGKEESAFGAVVKQTTIIAAVAAVLVLAVHPLLILIGNNTDWFDYEPLRFILGSAYGWLLGVGNFLAMAISLIVMTASPAERKDAQKRAQAMYMARLVALLLFAVGGCFIPVFHPAAILLSLAATQFGIFAYSLIFKLREASKQAKTEKNPPPHSDTESDVSSEQAQSDKTESSDSSDDGETSAGE